MHIVLYYTHDTTIVSSDPVIYYLIFAILVRAQNNFVPDFTGTGNIIYTLINLMLFYYVRFEMFSTNYPVLSRSQ